MTPSSSTQAQALDPKAIEEMRAAWRDNPAMPAYQRLLFDRICNLALAALPTEASEPVGQKGQKFEPSQSGKASEFGPEWGWGPTEAPEPVAWQPPAHCGLCIDCDGSGLYPSGAKCQSCLGTGLVDKDDGEAIPRPATVSSAPEPTYSIPAHAEWCQPGDMQDKRRFIVRFDDPDRPDAVFTDEAEARKFYGQATVSWNCWLFGSLPAHPAPATVSSAEPDRAAIIEECAKVAHKAHLTYAELRDSHWQDTLDWERADASCKAAAAIWHALSDLLPPQKNGSAANG